MKWTAALPRLGAADYVDTDSDNNGLSDTVEAITPDSPVDTNADGIANHLDLDSDNDGLTDTYEAGGANIDRDGIIDDFLDSDGDGYLDTFTDENRDGLDDTIALMPFKTIDIDMDGLLDQLDLDTDSDFASDLRETGFSDENGDRIIDSLKDADLDGIPDSVDVSQSCDEVTPESMTLEICRRFGTFG